LATVDSLTGQCRCPAERTSTVNEEIDGQMIRFDYYEFNTRYQQNESYVFLV